MCSAVLRPGLGHELHPAGCPWSTLTGSAVVGLDFVMAGVPISKTSYEHGLAVETALGGAATSAIRRLAF